MENGKVLKTSYLPRHSAEILVTADFWQMRPARRRIIYAEKNKAVLEKQQIFKTAFALHKYFIKITFIADINVCLHGFK